MVNKNRYGQWDRPLKYKRYVEYVTELEVWDVWNNPPTKAIVHYRDYSEGCYEASNPIKIKQRKNGTYYVQFENRRFDIDITIGNNRQPINKEGNNTILLSS